MLKKKKFFTLAVALVLMLAMAVTANAQTSYTCTLHASNTGSVATAGLSAIYTHFSAYNGLSSTDTMMARLQVYAGGWNRVSDVRLPADGYFKSTPPLHCDPAQQFRTKIWSEHGNGGVEGVGCIFDY